LAASSCRAARQCRFSMGRQARNCQDVSWGACDARHRPGDRTPAGRLHRAKRPREKVRDMQRVLDAVTARLARSALGGSAISVITTNVDAGRLPKRRSRAFPDRVPPATAPPTAADSPPIGAATFTRPRPSGLLACVFHAGSAKLPRWTGRQQGMVGVMARCRKGRQTPIRCDSRSASGTSRSNETTRFRRGWAKCGVLAQSTRLIGPRGSSQTPSRSFVVSSLSRVNPPREMRSAVATRPMSLC
jgi:hypothetical protein